MTCGSGNYKIVFILLEKVTIIQVNFHKIYISESSFQQFFIESLYMQSNNIKSQNKFIL